MEMETLFYRHSSEVKVGSRRHLNLSANSTRKRNTTKTEITKTEIILRDIALNRL